MTYFESTACENRIKALSKKMDSFGFSIYIRIWAISFALLFIVCCAIFAFFGFKSFELLVLVPIIPTFMAKHLKPLKELRVEEFHDGFRRTLHGFYGELALSLVDDAKAANVIDISTIQQWQEDVFNEFKAELAGTGDANDISY